MNAAQFRRIVLGHTGAAEGAHMGHADFRIDGRIFASLNAEATSGTVKLQADHQARFVEEHPGIFAPASGAWGRQGWTVIHLEDAHEEAVGEAVTLSWRTVGAMGVVKKKPGRAGTAKPTPGTTQARSAKPASGNRRVPRPSGKPTGTMSPIDAYIAACAEPVQPILETLRTLIRKEAPDAEERISYRMPAFFLDGALIYFAPFKQHIGIFPPIKGDAALNKALVKHRGEKGNLRFPLDEPMPYPLIRRVVRCRLKEHRAHLASRKGR